MENIIEQIIAIEKELTRRKDRDYLSMYNVGEKIHKKQLEFHKCQKKNRWVFGGNRSGKTECGAVEAIYMARGIHPYRENRKNVFGWVVSLSTQVQRGVAQAKILHYLNPSWIEDITMLSGKKDSPEYGIIDQIFIKNVFGGISTIGFKSCDQGREKFQGSSLDFVWFDEEPPKDIYDECRMRVLDKSGDIFGTMTPLKGLTFIYEDIYLNKNNNPEVWSEFMEWADNPYLREEDIALLTETLSNDQLESRRFGRFKENTGLVYPEFDENVHVIEPFNVPVDWQDTLSIDPGLNNPLSCHWYCVDYDSNVYVVAEHFEANHDIEYHSNRIKEISNRLNWKRNSFNKIDALIDSAANQKTLAGIKSVTELFNDYGIAVNPSVNKDMWTGIQRVKSYLKIKDGKPKLYIFKNCTNLSLDRLTFTPLTDAQLEAKATTLVSASQDEKLLKYTEDLHEQISKKTAEKTEKQSALATEISQITTRYQTSESAVEDKARKNGLASSSVILDKIAELESKKNAEITATQTKYNGEIATLTAEITALNLRLTNASTYYAGLFSSELAVKKQELTDSQNEKIMEVFKYNNGLAEKEKNSANNNIKTNASLQMKYLELSGDFFTKDQLIEMGYYNDVVDCICGYYNTLDPQVAYNDFRRTPKLAIYLDDYYDDLLYLYGSYV